MRTCTSRSRQRLHQEPPAQTVPGNTRTRRHCNALGPCHSRRWAPVQPSTRSLQACHDSSAAAEVTPQADAYAGHNPVNLAFLGDSIWEVHVRSVLLAPPKKATAYTLAVKDKVNAEFQAGLLQALIAAGQLSEAEKQLVSWAASYKNISTPARLAGPAGAEIYAQATAFEALLGHLHLHDPMRLQHILHAALPFKDS